MDLILRYIFSTLCPRSLFGGCVLVRSHNRMTLSIPAEATYLHVGWRSRDMMDYLCPLRVLIRHGSYSLFIVIVFKYYSGMGDGGEEFGGELRGLEG